MSREEMDFADRAAFSLKIWGTVSSGTKIALKTSCENHQRCGGCGNCLECVGCDGSELNQSGN